MILKRIEAKQEIYEEVISSLKRHGDDFFAYGIGNLSKWLPKYSKEEIQYSINKFKDDRLTVVSPDYKHTFFMLNTSNE